MKIGIIGTGTIASAVVEGLARRGHSIIVSERGASHSARLETMFEEVSVASNQGVVDGSDVLFLGLMAEVAPGVLGALEFRANQTVISLMAGFPLTKVAAGVAPAFAEAVMIPFPGIAQGGSPLMLLGTRDTAEALFGDRNSIYELASEEELSACLCAQAVLSPAVQMVADSAAWLGKYVSDPEAGEEFLRVLVGSSLLGSDCKTMLSALDTPGGFNQRLRNHMADHGVGTALQNGLDELHKPG